MPPARGTSRLPTPATRSKRRTRRWTNSISAGRSWKRRASRRFEDCLTRGTQEMPFKKLGLDPLLVSATRRMNYTEPTPIQAEAIPAILAGRDLIATAQTGTGKTAAFLLPILHRLLSLPQGTTRALVITPTRELAQQIDDVCLGLAYHTPLRVGLLMGGAPMGSQEKALRAGVELVVATPGRLLDHMRQNQARFDHLHTLVLDEADRMLGMGFLPDLKRIIARLPARRQTLLFSATMPPVIAELARQILREPQSVQ